MDSLKKGFLNMITVKALFIIIIFSFLSSCKEKPTVTTIEVTNIAATSALSGGNVTSDGGAAVTLRGVCWNTTPDPTIDNLKTNDGTGIGNFGSNLTGLSANTTYYVKAYATNRKGPSYGEQVSFKTYLYTFADIDGNSYNAMQIGTQVWMTENLKTTRYNDGSVIPLITDSSVWNNLTTPGYCWYNNDEATHKATYGALYNWHTISAANLCPTGWHVPSEAEWTALVDYLGGGGYAGAKLKETGNIHWISHNEGATNESRFTGLPGGTRSSEPLASYFNIGSKGYWWSTTLYAGNYALFWTLEDLNISVIRARGHKNTGMSVRCLKD